MIFGNELMSPRPIRQFPKPAPKSTTANALLGLLPLQRRKQKMARLHVLNSRALKRGESQMKPMAGRLVHPVFA